MSQAQEIRDIKNELVAQRTQMDKVMDLIEKMSEKVTHMWELNRSSSGSGGRFRCPLNCGADFAKV